MRRRAALLQQWLQRLRLDERGGVETPLVLTLSLFVVALFIAVAVAVPSFAAQQAQSVTDEMQQTVNYVAAEARNNVAGSQVQQGYLDGLAEATAARLLGRPADGAVLGDATGAVGASYITSVSLDSVVVLAPGDPVPGTLGATAREQGVAITFSMQATMLGLVHESTSRTVWAFPGNR